MVSLHHLGLLLLAAPMAIAVPTAPHHESEDTSPATSSVTVNVLPFSKDPESSIKARCSSTTRSTNFRLYSDAGCQNVLIGTLTTNWDSCSGGQSPELSNGATFQSVKWLSGANAQEFVACQFGHSCSDPVGVINQDPNICSSGGGLRFDKISITP